MSYRIELASQARKYVEKLDRPTRQRFADKFENLKEDPLKNSKALVNSIARSSRIGDWRIVFTIEEQNKVLLVVKILPRGDVYKNM